MQKGGSKQAFRERLHRALARLGPASSSELCRQLGVSQATFSRRISALRGEVLTTGRGRATRYAARRTVDGVRAPVPLYELPRRVGDGEGHLRNLHPVLPGGFYAEETSNGSGGAFHDDLPWYLQDLRPAGFLGRLIPQRHPELGAPRDITLWSADHVVRYAVRYGWDLPGAFVLGDEAHARALDEAHEPGNVVPTDERARRYPEFAGDVLSYGLAGSSAAGEQPKFLATRRDGATLTPVLVKFSPVETDGSARRVADLLVAEHLALETLRAHGQAAARSSVLVAGERTFLEVERFDRDGVLHRLGVVSLFAVDAAFLGSDLSSWTSSVERLAQAGIVSEDDVERVRWREQFGRFIGDRDQHFGNLSFFLAGTQVSSLAPAYDVLPSHYAPRAGELSDRPYGLPAPGPAHGETTLRALEAAERFWGLVQEASLVSGGFQQIAGENRARLRALRERLLATWRG